MYDFNHTDYSHSKNVVTATVAAPPKTLETLKLKMVLDGNDENYDLKLLNICLNKCLNDSQTLNNVCIH